jgi:hypothetical protein
VLIGDDRADLTPLLVCQQRGALVK